MWQDPIIEEIRRYREAYSARFNHDLAAICRDLRESQKESGQEVVSLPPKRLPVQPPGENPPVLGQSPRGDG